MAISMLLLRHCSDHRPAVAVRVCGRGHGGSPVWRYPCCYGDIAVTIGLLWLLEFVEEVMEVVPVWRYPCCYGDIAVTIGLLWLLEFVEEVMEVVRYGDIHVAMETLQCFGC